MCWGDAERTRKLKQAHRGQRAFDAHKKDSDTCSGGRTSCSSSHDALWDDDDVSTAGSDDGGSVSSSTSSSSRGGSPVSSKTPTSGRCSSRSRRATPTGRRSGPSRRPSYSRPCSPAAQRIARSPQDEGPGGLLEDAAPLPPSLRRVVPIVVPAELAPPSEYDLRSTNGLMKCVNAIAPLPTPEQLSAKHLVINELQRVVDIWLRRTLDALEGAPETKSTETATLLLGGSWHLKIFFSSLCEHSGKEASVSDLVARRKAAVPVLSFQLNSVRVDLLFARYAQKQAVPKHLPFLPGDEMQVMRGMDATSRVPLVSARDPPLARRRGLYSNKAGYLGGISWALLVCFVCQMFPRASVASIVHRFFSRCWRRGAGRRPFWWRTCPTAATPTMSSGTRSTTSTTEPTSCRSSRWLPAVNTAVNVNISTLRVLREEFARGQRIMDDLRRRSLSHPSSWNQLFTPPSIRLRWPPSTLYLRSFDHKAEAKENEVVGYYFIGYTINAPRRRSLGVEIADILLGRPLPEMPGTEELARNCVTSATRYFLATELDAAAEKKPGMEVEINYRSWNDLPSAVFLVAALLLSVNARGLFSAKRIM
ncbi:Poly(A) polymerase [Phytophthora cinnamomi]|uniref:Poly(A) polymerase n=1 Tax=Phytophthora cinnamomi TaxID=4785 RepID=UPI00355A8F3F|nr:Poly(A) polymerase [Phytophthora cinnamomi]